MTESHGQVINPDGHPVGPQYLAGPDGTALHRFDPPVIGNQPLQTYADAARVASQVVGSPAVMDEIRKAAGIDDVIDIDLDWLTLDEIDVLEAMTGEPFDKFMQGQGLKGPSLRVLGLILKRRTDPHFPVERAGEIKVRMAKQAVPPTQGGVSAR
jgi:hypothetical protein